MKLFPTIRVLQFSLWCISLLLATSSPAQEINRQVGDPLGGINASVNPEVNADASRQPTAESAFRSRTAPPASTFGARSQPISTRPTASKASSRNLPDEHPDLAPNPVAKTPAAGQKHIAHLGSSSASSTQAHLAFGDPQGESAIASSHSHGGKQARHASSAKHFAAQNHNGLSGGNTSKRKTKSSHLAKQKPAK